jgi:pimeloyl-ACP methyl ester carboxylesterase
MTSARFTSSRGLTVEHRGTGPAAVLLHGWCLSRKLWMYEEEALLPDHHVITPDLAGYGRSDDLDGPYSLDRHVDDIIGVLNDLDVEDVTIVGFAFGAAVAMGVAASGCTRLGRVVLIGVPSAAHSPYDKMPRAMRRDWPEFARRSAQAICAQPLTDASMGWLEEMFGATPLPVALAGVELLGQFEPETLAPQVQVPALLVHGADDAIVPVSISEACAKLMARSRVEVVDECGHLVVVDQKARLHELVADFITTRN